MCFSLARSVLGSTWSTRSLEIARRKGWNTASVRFIGRWHFQARHCEHVFSDCQSLQERGGGGGGLCQWVIGWVVVAGAWVVVAVVVRV